MDLRGFIDYLVQRDPRLRETHIARKVKLSQAFVNKIVHHGLMGDPSPETCLAFYRGYPDEWVTYFSQRGDVMEALGEKYAWLWGLVNQHPEHSVQASACPLHPEIKGADMQETWRHLSYIYRNRDKHAELWRKVREQIETVHNYIELMESATAQKMVTKRRAR